MSCFNLQKKLKQLPSSSKKAWKSFTSTLSPKLRHLHNQSLNLTKTTTRHLLDLCHHKHHRRAPPPRGAHDTFRYNKQYNNYYQHLKQQPYSSGEPSSSPATVYVDRLFEESYSTSKEAAETTEPSTSGGGGVGGGTSRNVVDGGKKKKTKVGQNNKNNNKSNSNNNNDNNNNNNSNNNSNNNWKEYVLSMPTIRGVDERAEDFISQFRQQIQIQREQSLIEFQEMLARTA